MTPVDAAAVSGADMVNSLPQPGVFGQFLTSFYQPVVITIRPFLPVMKNAVLVQPVWSKNSCGFARVVFQESPEPFATLYRACTLAVLADRRKEQDVALALVIPLVMKMRHILRQRMA